MPVLGLTMVVVGGWDITTLWILASLGLYVLLVIVGAGFYSPTLRRQIAALDVGGATSPEFRALTARGNAIGALVGVIVVVIVGLMVMKPTL